MKKKNQIQANLDKIAVILIFFIVIKFIFNNDFLHFATFSHQPNASAKKKKLVRRRVIKSSSDYYIEIYDQKI